MSKIRVLHVVGRMHRAGIETWLVNVLRRQNLDRFQVDFCVHTSVECAYDAELIARGSRIYRVLTPKRSPAYPAALARVLREAGPFDIIHSHEHHLSGVILWIARRLGIPVRIAHSHNDTNANDALPYLPRFSWAAAMRFAIRCNFVHGLACGAQAAPSLFGPGWRRDSRITLLPYGFDFDGFSVQPDRAQLRASLGIPPGQYVVGHVGRFERQKNHAFFLEIAAALRTRPGDFHFLLVGEGILRSQVESDLHRLNLHDSFTLLNCRGDIPEILRGGMDCFLFPSLHEGLPLAMIEAQAAGLPCLYSSSITPEADLFPESNRALSLDTPAAEWAGKLLELRRLPRNPDNSQRLARLRRSPLAIEECVRKLETLYETCHGAVG